MGFLSKIFIRSKKYFSLPSLESKGFKFWPIDNYDFREFNGPEMAVSGIRKLRRTISSFPFSGVRFLEIFDSVQIKYFQVVFRIRDFLSSSKLSPLFKYIFQTFLEGIQKNLVERKKFSREEEFSSAQLKVV